MWLPLSILIMVVNYLDTNSPTIHYGNGALLAGA